MRNRITFYIAIPMLFAFVCYLLTSSIMYAGAVFLLGVVISLLIIEQLISKYQKKLRKGEETYRFINSFIISLSATNSMEISLQNAMLGMDKEESEIISSFQDKGLEERLNYLSRYFDSDIYKVFLSTIKLFQDEGGEILDVANPLLKESLAIEEERIARKKNALTATVQFSSLWLMSLFVMAVLRFGLSTFYESLVNNLLYIFMCLSYFGLAYVSFVVFALGVSKEKIKFNWKGGKKNAFKKKKQN